MIKSEVTNVGVLYAVIVELLSNVKLSNYLQYCMQILLNFL